MWVVRNPNRGRFDIGEERRARERGVEDYEPPPFRGDEDGHHEKHDVGDHGDNGGLRPKREARELLSV